VKSPTPVIQRRRHHIMQIEDGIKMEALANKGDQHYIRHNTTTPNQRNRKKQPTQGGERTATAAAAASLAAHHTPSPTSSQKEFSSSLMDASPAPTKPLASCHVSPFPQKEQVQNREPHKLTSILLVKGALSLYVESDHQPHEFLGND
jgi:hypothetical protein